MSAIRVSPVILSLVLLAAAGASCGSSEEVLPGEDGWEEDGEEEEDGGEAGEPAVCTPFEPFPGYVTCLMPASPGPGEVFFQDDGSTAPTGLPGAVDHKAYLDGCMEVHSQGGCGWCTAHAATASLESYLCRDDVAYERISEPHLWSLAGRDVADCRGLMHLLQAMEVIRDHKLVRGSLWPYSDDTARRVAARPAQDVLEANGRYGTDDFGAVSGRDVEALKRALSGGFNVVYALPVFRGTGWDCTLFPVCPAWGTLTLPGTPPPAMCLCECPRNADGTPIDAGCTACPDQPNCVIGYHAVLMTGYSDAESRFTFLNSWSSWWAGGGYGTAPYGLVEAHGEGGYYPGDLAVVETAGFCGDGACSAGESPCSCPEDCGACTGCCDGETCREGTAVAACGVRGEPCEACDASLGETCSGGGCSGGCVADGFEPNRTSSGAARLPDTTDASAASSVSASLCPAADEDWFSVHVADTLLSNLQGTISLSGLDADLDLCVTYACDAGPTTLTCIGAGNVAEGTSTCCSAARGTSGETVAFEQDCGGLLAPGDGTATIRVFSASSEATDGGYQLTYGF
jgi:hypothetical protein